MGKRDRDRERFELLYAAHYDRVLAYALCRAEVDGARDAAAETFLVAWRRLGDVPDDPLPWLIGVARRCLADQRRASGRRDALSTRLRRVSDARHEWGVDPAEAAVERDQVAAAVRRLPDLDRELLCLVAWDGLSPTQAAESLGCSRATLAVRLHRARRRLVAALDAEEASEAGVAKADPRVGDFRSANSRVDERSATDGTASDTILAGFARPGAHPAPVFTRARLAGASGPGPTAPPRLASPPASGSLIARPEEAS